MAGMMLQIEKGIISEVRLSPGTERYPPRLNFTVSTTDCKVNLAMPGATQADFDKITALALEPVRITSQLHVRQYNNTQYFELRAPEIVRLIPVSRPQPEPAK